MVQSGIETIKNLKGSQLNEVIFSQDSVQIHFQGNRDEQFQTLTPVSGLIVENKEDSFSFPGPGSRDALCALIGASVEKIEVERNSHIRFRFSDSSHLTILLKGAQGPVSLSSLISVKRGELWRKAGLKPL